MTLRLHTASTDLDPDALEPGRDLVVHLNALHGVDARAGTYVMDHLDAAGRAAADRAALAVLGRWREHLDEPLTVAGVCWPFVWQLALYRELNRRVASALALHAALRSTGAQAVELADTGAETEQLAQAVCAAHGVPLARASGAGPPGALGPPHPEPSRAARARRSVLDAVAGLGAPSLLRRGSVAVHAYWPLMPLLDRLLAEPGGRPALFWDKRPAGVRRSLAVARRGGFVGAPTPADRRWARSRADTLVAAAEPNPGLPVEGLELGDWLHPRLAAIARDRAAADLASARMYRRAFRRGARWVVGAYDVDPDARLMVVMAQEAGVRTLMLCHGAYVLPQPFGDLDVCDEVALWSLDVAPDMSNWDRPIHVVGYPLPHDPPPPTRAAPADRPPRVAVLGQGTVPSTCVLDERTTMAAYDVAIAAVAGRFPDAEVVLRPNPRQDASFFRRLRERFPDVRLEERRGGDILAVHREADLLIGGASTASFQAALVGTPLVLLNLTGTEWPFPLGGDRTRVPVARSPEELDAALARWQRDRSLPGGEDLLSALGVGQGDPVERLLAILDGTAPAPPDRVRQAVSPAVASGSGS